MQNGYFQKSISAKVFRFGFDSEDGGLFLLMAALFAGSMLIDTDARTRAGYQHRVQEKAKQEIAEIEKVEKKVQNTKEISEQEAADILKELEDTKKALEDAENYQEIQKAAERGWVKLSDAAHSGNQALNQTLSEAVEQKQEQKNKNLEQLIKETQDALNQAEDGTSAEKEYAAEKMEELAAALGNSELSTSAEAYSQSEKNAMDAAIAKRQSNKRSHPRWRPETIQAAMEIREVPKRIRTAAETRVIPKIIRTITEIRMVPGMGRTVTEIRMVPGTGRMAAEIRTVPGTGRMAAEIRTVPEMGRMAAEIRMVPEMEQAPAGIKAAKMVPKGKTKTAETVTIPNGDVGTDENLTGKGTGGGQNTYEKSDQSLTWSGNKVSYGQVSGEYKEKAYRSLETSTYPDSMKDKIKTYFDGLN